MEWNLHIPIPCQRTRNSGRRHTLRRLAHQSAHHYTCRQHISLPGNKPHIHPTSPMSHRATNNRDQVPWVHQVSPTGIHPIRRGMLSQQPQARMPDPSTNPPPPIQHHRRPRPLGNRRAGRPKSGLKIGQQHQPTTAHRLRDILRCTTSRALLMRYVCQHTWSVSVVMVRSEQNRKRRSVSAVTRFIV